jgi:hypothetical protein
LIPKKDGADRVQDFRPIILIHGFAKLVAKVLANRLAQKVLPQMVGVHQSAFVRGRCLHDGPGDGSQASQQLNSCCADQAGYNKSIRHSGMALSLGGPEEAWFRDKDASLHLRPFVLGLNPRPPEWLPGL